MNCHILTERLSSQSQRAQQLTEAGSVDLKVHAQDGMRVCASVGSFHRQATPEKAVMCAIFRTSIWTEKQAEQQALRQFEMGKTSLCTA